MIDLVPHLDAGDRTKWQGDQNVRPLTDLGRQQATVIANALAEEQVDALYASPALRCRQSLEPLAERFGLEIESWQVLVGTRHGGVRRAGIRMLKYLLTPPAARWRH